MDEEKNPTKAEQPLKITVQLVLPIDEAINPKTKKAVDQEVVANVLEYYTTQGGGKFWTCFSSGEPQSP